MPHFAPNVESIGVFVVVVVCFHIYLFIGGRGCTCMPWHRCNNFDSLLPPCGFHRSNSSPQAWQPVPLDPESPHRPPNHELLQKYKKVRIRGGGGKGKVSSAPGPGSCCLLWSASLLPVHTAKMSPQRKQWAPNPSLH